MKRVLILALVSSFALAEPTCDKGCKSTWSQWLGDAVFMVLAYEGASARVPALQTANTWIATKAAEYGPIALAFIQTKLGKTAEGTTKKE